MKFEGTFQYMGNHGIVFNVSQITLTDSERGRGRLRELHFGEAKSAHYEVNSKVVEVYDKMQAKSLPCVMMIGISKPLTRQQGDVLNAQRTTIANLAASAFAAATKVVAPSYMVVPVGPVCARMSMESYPPTMRATYWSASRHRSTAVSARNAPSRR